MISVKPGLVVPFAMAVATLSTLAACGGGGDDPPAATAAAPQAPAPAPTPAPAPAPAPTPAPTPEPQHTPAPEPAPHPAPTPEPQPQPTPAPAPEPMPAPAPQPAPEPTPQPAPQPTPAPAPQPTPAPAPQPGPQDPPAPPPITLAPGYTELSATVTFSQPYWPAWSHSGRQPVDGVNCLKNENYHIHALVSVYRDGIRLALPDAIGRSGCAYELHTHDGSGVVHIETDVPKVFTLGQFFSLWGQPLTTATVAGLPGTPHYYIIDNEKITPVGTDPRAIVLSAHREVLIVTGTPPTQVPRYNWMTSGM